MDEILHDLDPLKILGVIKRAARRPKDAWEYARFWWQTWDEDLKTTKGNFYFLITTGFVGLGLFAWSWPGPFDLVLIPVAIVIARYTLMATIWLWRKAFGPARKFRPKRRHQTSLLVLVFLAAHYGAKTLQWAWWKVCHVRQ